MRAAPRRPAGGSSQRPHRAVSRPAGDKRAGCPGGGPGFRPCLGRAGRLREPLSRRPPDPEPPPPPQMPPAAAHELPADKNFAQIARKSALRGGENAMPKGKNSINVGGGVVPRSVGIYSRPKCSNCVESRPLRPRRPRQTPGPDGQLEGAGRRPPTLRPCVPAASPARPEPWNDGSRRISESAPRGPQTVPLAGRPARSPRATRGVRVSGRGV